jgi:hypothetical protein
VPTATDAENEGAALLKIIGDFLLGEYASYTLIGDRRIS